MNKKLLYHLTQFNFEEVQHSLVPITYKVWTNSGNFPARWSHKDNWTNQTVPQDGDNVLFTNVRGVPTSLKQCNLDVNTNDLNSLTILPTYSGAAAFSNFTQKTISVTGDCKIWTG